MMEDEARWVNGKMISVVEPDEPMKSLIQFVLADSQTRIAIPLKSIRSLEETDAGQAVLYFDNRPDVLLDHSYDDVAKMIEAFERGVPLPATRGVS